MKLEKADFSADSEFELFSCEELKNVDFTVYGPEYEITYEDMEKKTEGCFGINKEQRKKLMNIIYNCMQFYYNSLMI